MVLTPEDIPAIVHALDYSYFNCHIDREEHRRLVAVVKNLATETLSEEEQ
jgi:hypothetical protein